MSQVPGVVTGKQGGNGIYVPSIYSKSQSEWVDNFYKQNGYLGSYTFHMFVYFEEICVIIEHQVSNDAIDA